MYNIQFDDPMRQAHFASLLSNMDNFLSSSTDEAGVITLTFDGRASAMVSIAAKSAGWVVEDQGSTMVLSPRVVTQAMEEAALAIMQGPQVEE